MQRTGCGSPPEGRLFDGFGNASGARDGEYEGGKVKNKQGVEDFLWNESIVMQTVDLLKASSGAV